MRFVHLHRWDRGRELHRDITDNSTAGAHELERVDGESDGRGAVRAVDEDVLGRIDGLTRLAPTTPGP